MRRTRSSSERNGSVVVWSATGSVAVLIGASSLVLLLLLVSVRASIMAAPRTVRAKTSSSVVAVRRQAFGDIGEQGPNPIVGQWPPSVRDRCAGTAGPPPAPVCSWRSVKHPQVLAQQGEGGRGALRVEAPDALPRAHSVAWTNSRPWRTITGARCMQRSTTSTRFARNVIGIDMGPAWRGRVVRR